jgi:hypothetical protein
MMRNLILAVLVSALAIGCAQPRVTIDRDCNITATEKFPVPETYAAQEACRKHHPTPRPTVEPVTAYWLSVERSTEYQPARGGLFRRVDVWRVGKLPACVLCASTSLQQPEKTYVGATLPDALGKFARAHEHDPGR